MSKVYIYQSCLPIASFTNINTQIIQTEKVSEVNLGGEIFKDVQGNCWTYIGEYDNTYQPPFDVFSINYSGSYFTNVVNIKYPSCESCELTVVSSCTEVYFSSVRCDTTEVVNVKVCNVGPLVGTLKLVPSVGDTCGVKNPYGDDFCVTLTGTSTDTTTVYEINTPAWKFYDCKTCPVYKTYTANSCDGTVTGITLYQLSGETTIEVGNSVRISTDELCYEIISYDGIIVEYNATNSDVPFIGSAFNSCESCLINYYST